VTSTGGHRQPSLLRAPARALLCTAIGCALIAGAAHAGPSAPADADFDMSLLAGAQQSAVDLSRFERGEVIMPGVYRLDLYLDGRWSGSADVRFESPAPDTNAVPCFTPALVEQFGLPIAKLDEAARARLAAQQGCVGLAELIPGATSTYDQSALRLDVTVPQAWLGYRARGYVSPSQWTGGVNAALLNYNANLYRTTSGNFDQTSGYVGLDAGVNLGAWHFRHNGNYTWQSSAGDRGSDHRYQSAATYVRRDLTAWRSQLTLGDTFTSGELFDNVGVRGVQVSTDDRMLPESLRGYAPTVRGVAETNARVTIRQNGVLLYETTVTPGPFAIDDLFATGYGGDLDVVVTEADGRVRQFWVPYASVPQQLRPGSYRFSVTAGVVHDENFDEDPALVQATLQRGLSNAVTGYGGVVGSDGYLSALGGVALNTKLGALALDVTAARTQIPGQETRNGQSVRATYSKIFPDTKTSFSLASYRYSTSGFYSLREALAAREFAQGRPADSFLDDDGQLPGVLTPEEREALQGEREVDVHAQFNDLDRQRNRFDLNLNQQLGERGGTLYATASARDYWTRSGTDVQFQVGYNNRYRWFGYSLSATRLRDLDGRYSNQFYVNFSVPLGSSARAPSLTAGLVRDDAGQTQSQASMAGTAGADGQVTYGATASHSDEVGTSASVNGTYRGGYGVASASYGKGDGYSQASAGVSGAVVAHPMGVTLGQAVGETMAIVSAPHATGARVLNAPGVKINGQGLAIVPYLTPYAMNTVELDPKGLSLNVELAATSARVAPRAGSVAVVTFQTTHGNTMLVRLRTTGGEPLPFGAEINDAQGRSLGYIGQGGRALLRGVDAQGALDVRWQENGETARSCRFQYRMPESSGQDAHAMPTTDATCADVVVPFERKS